MGAGANPNYKNQLSFLLKQAKEFPKTARHFVFYRKPLKTRLNSDFVRDYFQLTLLVTLCQQGNEYGLAGAPETTNIGKRVQEWNLLKLQSSFRLCKLARQRACIRTTLKQHYVTLTVTHCFRKTKRNDAH